MSNEAKYIILREYPGQYGTTDDVAIVFDNTIAHDVMASGFRGKRNIVGAGFVYFESQIDDIDGQVKVKVQTYGESYSLGIQSRAEDQAIVQKALIPPNPYE